MIVDRGMQMVCVLLLLIVVRKVNTLMADAQKLSDDLDAVGVAIADVAAEVAALKAQGPALITQEQLDALDAKAQALAAAAVAAK